jgi:hypothetical protein
MALKADAIQAMVKVYLLQPTVRNSKRSPGQAVTQANFPRRYSSRSEWDPETLKEGQYDVAKNLRLFEEANALYRIG